MRTTIYLSVLFATVCGLCRQRSTEGRYCLDDGEGSNETVLRFRRDLYGTVEYVWPDDEAEELVRTSGETFNSIGAIYFENNCNWRFNWKLAGQLIMPNLRLLSFDVECATWSEQQEHCVDLPTAWSRPEIHLSNVFECVQEDDDGAQKNAETSLKFQKDINQMLNNTLNRALHLQKMTEQQNKEFNRTLNAMEQRLQTCSTLLVHLSHQVESLESRLSSCLKSRTTDQILLKHYKFVLSRLRQELFYVLSLEMNGAEFSHDEL